MAPNYGPKIVKDGLVLCLDAANPRSYPGSGTTWFDLSKNGNNGTLTNGPLYSSDNNGYLTFDGSNDYASVPHDSYQNSSNLTINVWVMFNSLTTGNIIGKSYNSGYRLRGDDDSGQFSIEFLDRGGTNFLSTEYGLIQPLIWYHIVSTASPSGLQIYINGNLSASNSTAFGGTGTTEALAIARPSVSNSSESFNGKISNVSLYTKVLSETEIKQNYNALKGRYGL